MNILNHKPGSWYLETWKSEKGTIGYVKSMDPVHNEICVIFNGAMDVGNIISAAPDLLDGLRTAANQLLDLGQDTEWIEKLIEKAEGKNHESE